MPTEDLQRSLKAHWNEAIKLVDTIEVTIKTGESFLDKYKNALIKVAKLCTVKRNLEKPPSINLTVVK